MYNFSVLNGGRQCEATNRLYWTPLFCRDSCYYLIRKRCYCRLQWKPRDATENFDTYRNLQPHRAVLPAIAWHLVSSVCVLFCRWLWRIFWAVSRWKCHVSLWNIRPHYLQRVCETDGIEKCRATRQQFRGRANLTNLCFLAWACRSLQVEATTHFVLLARDSIYIMLSLESATSAAAIASPSVCLSVTRVDQPKTVEVRIMQLSPRSSPMTSFLVVNFTAKFQREHRERDAK